MQNIAIFSNLIDRWLRYRFQTILIVFFLLWTPLLVAETLQVQHSCYPMIHWSNTIVECQSKPPQHNFSSSKKIKERGDTFNIKIATNENKPFQNPFIQPPTPSASPQLQTPEERNLIENVIQLAKDNPDLTGGVIGIGVAGTVATATTAPLAVAVAVGAAVWFAIRTVL